MDIILNLEYYCYHHDLFYIVAIMLAVNKPFVSLPRNTATIKLPLNGRVLKPYYFCPGERIWNSLTDETSGILFPITLSFYNTLPSNLIFG